MAGIRFVGNRPPPTALATAVAVDRLDTWTGTVEAVVVPFPCWPRALSPHVHTLPSVFRAAELPSPALTADTLVSPLTAPGA